MNTSNKNQNNSLYSMRKIPSQSRSKATTDAILSAAVQVLIKDGYKKTNTRKIADRAGVSIGSLYEYFPGKEAIFASVERREDERLYELTMARPEPNSVEELIRLHTSIHLKLVRSNLPLYAALINDLPQFAVKQTELRFHKDYKPKLLEFLRAHNSELRRDYDIEQIADFATRTGRSIINNYVLNDPDRLNEKSFEDMLVDMLTRFVLQT